MAILVKIMIDVSSLVYVVGVLIFLLFRKESIIALRNRSNQEGYLNLSPPIFNFNSANSFTISNPTSPRLKKTIYTLIFTSLK